MARFKPLGGLARRYLDTQTGEEISRWQYQKLTNGLDFREQARTNRKADPMLAELRPAKGRKSAVKSVGLERELIAEARLEEREKKKALEEKRKAEKKLNSTIQRKQKRKVRQKQVSKQLLKPGSYGARISFIDYDGYVKAVKEAQKTGVVFSYSLGLIGVDENTGADLGITAFKLTHVNSIYSRKVFEDEMSAVKESYSYFIFLHYFMHLAYKKDFAQSRANQKGLFKNGKKRK